MYPGTEINKWYDETVEITTTISTVDNAALFMTASSFDKGPEAITRVSGTNFYSLFGSTNRYTKHGQAAIQASRIIDAGGELLIKRIVANDATLANVVFLATLNTSTDATPDVEAVQTDTVSIPSQETEWLGKKISDLVADDIVVEADGTVNGTIHYAAFEAFDGVDTTNQTGHYFPFVLNTTGTTMSLKVNGVVTKEDVPFDSEIIFRIADPSYSYEVLVDGESYISLNFAKAKFENEDGSVDSGSTEVEVSSNASVKLSAAYIENCYSFDQLKEEALKLYDPENGVYPLIIVGDNGRGKSNKAINISRNTDVSSSIGKQFYTVSIYEGTTRIETLSSTLDSTIYNGTQYGFDEFSASQVKFYVDSAIADAYKIAIADAAGLDASNLSSYDLLNLKTIKGALIDGIDIDAESIDLGVAYGVSLNGGSNGEFGDKPVNTPAWEAALNEFFSGDFSNEIYDLDEYKVGAILDACYPYSVKETIAELVTFREDCVFFRDMCFDADSYGTTLEVLTKFKTNNKFIANYMSWYQIYDPDTKKRIPVTLMYDLAACLVNEFDTGIHYPTAGIANGFILESAIEGTLNYTPRKTPKINQKQMMDDARVNYAIFQSGQCIVQSLYTSQEAYSQLSYINNVMGIQEVIRTVRTECPKMRYTFIDNGDFSKYATDVNHVLAEFSSNFDTLEFEYYQDTLLANHKIFYAAISFAFKDWAQTEMFDIYAIKNGEIQEDTIDVSTTTEE